MVFNEDKRVKLPVPFIKDSTVLFVDSPAGAFHSFIEKNIIQLIIRLRGAGYTFLFLPDMVDRLSPEMLQFLFPGQKDGLTYFRFIPESTEGGVSEAVDGFVSFLTERCENDLYEPTGDIRFREKEYSVPTAGWTSASSSIISRSVLGRRISNGRRDYGKDS